jgi:phosphohistidine swiveling domain-containing protein
MTVRVTVVALDSPQGRDPEVVGAKAAGLARARAAGLPVPDTIVVPCTASIPSLTDGQVLAGTRGIHAGRLLVMSQGQDALRALVSEAGRIGPSLAVRSSARTEDDPALAGAFSSLIGVTPEEVPTAVLSVWSSAIRNDGSDEPPPMGVIIQPELHSTYAGSAEVRPDGGVEVVWTDGPAAPLMAGWDRGRTAVYGADGSTDPDVRTGPEGAAVAAAARLALQVLSDVGDDLIEWAVVGEEVWLLQCRRQARTSPRTHRDPSVPRAAHADVAEPPADPARLRAVARAARARGPLGERWALPWLVASRHALPELLGSGSSSDDEPRLWRDLRRTSDAITRAVWGVPEGREQELAHALAGGLRAGREMAPDLVAARAPDEALVSQIAEIAARLTALLRADGRLSARGDVWALPEAAAYGVPTAAADPAGAARAWEPELFEAVRHLGVRSRGVGVSDGLGSGVAISARSAALSEGRAMPPRAVLVAEHPLPRYSPLLMNASGLVTHGGSAAAHLVSVARSLGVPVVTGCDLAARGATITGLVAVDGSSGEVFALDDRAALS